MHIIKKKTLIKYWEQHPDSKAPLESWHAEMKKNQFPGPQEIKDRYPKASILADNRVVFDIKGNRYRLIVKFRYETQTGFIRFVGTHAEYDKIDAENI